MGSDNPCHPPDRRDERPNKKVVLRRVMTLIKIFGITLLIAFAMVIVVLFVVSIFTGDVGLFLRLFFVGFVIPFTVGFVVWFLSTVMKA